MQYDGFAWCIALFALLALLIALRILLTRHWLLGWLRGTLGLALLGLAALIGLVAHDLMSYALLPRDKPLATLGFHAEGPQRYRVALLEGAQERSFLIDGELWQLDGRLLRWKGLAELIGLQPGYRLQRLSGRFLAIERQNQVEHGQAHLAPSAHGMDLWQWLRSHQRSLWLFDPQVLRLNYLPMADGAVFAIRLGPTGAVAEAMNPAAEQALRDWR